SHSMSLSDRRPMMCSAFRMAPPRADEELRTPSEEVRQRGAPLLGVESIHLVDPHPRQRLPPPRQLVAPPRQLLLGFEQLEPRAKPLLTCRAHVLRHGLCLLCTHRYGLLPANSFGCHASFVRSLIVR